MSRITTQRILLPLLLFTSGLCGISYEILYGRLLGNIIGDQFVVSTAVLLTFLLGIGLGALQAHKLWSRLWLIEACIGIYAVTFAVSLPAIESLLYAYLPSIGISAITSIGAAVTLLLIPAFAIGVSLPVFAGYAHRLRPDEGYFSSTYGVYNFAAAVTVIVIEFWLIRETGIKQAVFFIAILNIVVALGLVTFFRDVAGGAPQQLKVSGTGFSRQLLLALAISSVGSAVFQLTAIRLSELLFGPFRETFAYVLCIILLGIALGSLLVNRFKVGFVPLMLANIVFLAWALGGLQGLMKVFSGLYPLALDSYWQLVALKFSCIAALTLGPATTFGATIPALLNTLRKRDASSGGGDREAARSAGYLLYVASLANAAGFLLMCLVLHQRLDYGQLLVVVAGLSGLSLLVLWWGQAEHWLGKQGRVALPVCVLVSLGGVGFVGKSLWNEELLYQGYMSFHSPGALRQRVGEHATSERYKGEQDVLSISHRHGMPYFIINGKLSIKLDDAAEKVVGALGGIFASDHRRAMVLGVGSGATAGAVGLLFDEVEAVEISGVILDTLPRLKQYNFDLANMPNVRLVHDDAIHAVKVARGEYSLILNTVTSPLFFSSSKLYTVDFLQEVKSHLAPGGLYMTWLDSRVGDRGADIMVESVSRVFDHCGLAQLGSSYLLMLCSDTPTVAHHPMVVAQQRELAAYFREEHSINPAGLAYQLLHPNLAALRNPEGAPLNTLDKPVLEFSMTRVAKRTMEALQARIVLALKLENLVAPFAQFEWGFLPLLESIKRVSGNDLFYQAWKMEFDSFTGFYRQGLAAEQSGDCQQAVEYFNRAGAIDNRWHQLNLRLGRCYEIQGHHEEALAAYGREKALDGDNHQLTMLQGRTLIWLERYQAALSTFRQVPRPERAGAFYYLMGRTLDGLGDASGAEKFYEAAGQASGSIQAAAREALQITGE
jgi:spermidine synthase